jgi:5-methylcytosine-specific restriction endonuclease McrA
LRKAHYTQDREERALDRSFQRVLALDPCAYCGAPAAVLDHVTARLFDGCDDWTNRAAACRSCNSSKGALTLLGFLLRRRLRVGGGLTVTEMDGVHELGMPWECWT